MKKIGVARATLTKITRLICGAALVLATMTLSTNPAAAATTTPTGGTWDERAVIPLPSTTPTTYTATTSGWVTDEYNLVGTYCYYWTYYSHEATAWYAFAEAPADDMGVFLSTSGSNYPVGYLVVDLDNPSSVQCGNRVGAFRLTAGHYYALVLFDTSGNTGVDAGGNLKFTLTEKPLPMVSDLFVNPVAELDSKTGLVTVSGTVSCSGLTSNLYVYASLSQKMGRKAYISGSGSVYVPCNGTDVPWSVNLRGSPGSFSSGAALANISASGSNQFFSASQSLTWQYLQLKAAKR